MCEKKKEEKYFHLDLSVKRQNVFRAIVISFFSYCIVLAISQSNNFYSVII